MEKYNLSKILGIPKKFPVYGKFKVLKQFLQKLRLYEPSVGFSWKRNYIQDLDSGTLSVNVCAKNLTGEQVALVLDTGDDVVQVETPEAYKNF